MKIRIEIDHENGEEPCRMEMESIAMGDVTREQLVTAAAQTIGDWLMGEMSRHDTRPFVSPPPCRPDEQLCDERCFRCGGTYRGRSAAERN